MVGTFIVSDVITSDLDTRFRLDISSKFLSIRSSLKNYLFLQLTSLVFENGIINSFHKLLQTKLSFKVETVNGIIGFLLYRKVHLYFGERR